MYSAIVGLLSSLPRILDFLEKWVESSRQRVKKRDDKKQLEKDKPKISKAIDDKDSESLNNILNS